MHLRLATLALCCVALVACTPTPTEFTNDLTVELISFTCKKKDPPTANVIVKVSVAKEAKKAADYRVQVISVTKNELVSDESGLDTLKGGKDYNQEVIPLNESSKITITSGTKNYPVGDVFSPHVKCGAV